MYSILQCICTFFSTINLNMYSIFSALYNEMLQFNNKHLTIRHNIYEKTCFITFFFCEVDEIFYRI